MDNLEKVEKLVEKTGVSYEEANRALTEANGDLLNAIILLEREGQFKRNTTAGYEHVRGEEIPPERGPKKDSAKNFGLALKRLVETLIKSDFHVRRNGENLFSVPVLVLVLCLIFAFWITVIALGAGFFFGLRYSFGGVVGIGKDVKDVIARAADAAEDVKSSIDRIRNEQK